MINLDQYLFQFISGNWFTLTLFLGLLKIVAEMTDWVVDNKVHTLLAGMLGMIKRPPVGMSPAKDRGEEIS